MCYNIYIYIERERDIDMPLPPLRPRPGGGRTRQGRPRGARTSSHPWAAVHLMLLVSLSWLVWLLLLLILLSKLGVVLLLLLAQIPMLATRFSLGVALEKTPYDQCKGKSLRDSEKLWEVSLYAYAQWKRQSNPWAARGASGVPGGACVSRSVTGVGAAAVAGRSTTYIYIYIEREREYCYIYIYI